MKTSLEDYLHHTRERKNTDGHTEKESVIREAVESKYGFNMDVEAHLTNTKIRSDSDGERKARTLFEDNINV
jgi:hypothetical protein